MPLIAERAHERHPINQQRGYERELLAYFLGRSQFVFADAGADKTQPPAAAREGELVGQKVAT